MEDRPYRIAEFAALAGVTVRALHFYDRIGLLKPRRTEAGHRVYILRDLECLEQIVALKFIGLPLKKIAVLREANALELANALAAQRSTLAEKQNLLGQAIAALADLEATLRNGRQPDVSAYKHVIKVMDMSNSSDTWQQKYDELVKTKIEYLSALSSEEKAALQEQWSALFQDVESALDEDPASPRAQELASRWMKLLGRFLGHFEGVDRDLPSAAALYPQVSALYASGNWSPAPAVPSLDKRVQAFISRALAARQAD